MEDLLIKKIEGGIRGIKNGTKTLKEANINDNLDRLRKINPGMADDLLVKYVEAVKNLKK